MYGQTTDIALNFQNSYGTQLVNSLYFIPFLSENIGVEKPPLISQNMQNRFDDGDVYEGANMTNGDLSAEAQAIPLGVMLKAVMGDPVTVTSSGIHTHTFKPRTADWDSKAANIPVTYYKAFDTGSAQLHHDLVGNTLEMNIANAELLSAKVGFVGGALAQQAAVAASYPTGKKWAWDATSASIGGNAKSELTQATITLNENLAASHTLNNTKTPSRVKRTGFRSIEISGTLKFDDQDEYQSFLNQDERPMVVHFEGTTEIQSGYNESITVTIPTLRHNELKPASEGPGEIEVSFTSKGVYNTGSGTGLQVTLVNTQAAY